ncbi:unnamed protein product [Gadus morhua 'NCC']
MVSLGSVLLQPHSFIKKGGGGEGSSTELHLHKPPPLEPDLGPHAHASVGLFPEAPGRPQAPLSSECQSSVY